MGNIDVIDREVEQEKHDAEISFIDDCKSLEVGENDNMEIKTDNVIETEEKEDDKETRTDNVIEIEEKEDIIDVNGREVEQQTYDAEISVTLEVEKNDDIEKEEKEDDIAVKL